MWLRRVWGTKGVWPKGLWRSEGILYLIHGSEKYGELRVLSRDYWNGVFKISSDYQVVIGGFLILSIT